MKRIIALIIMALTVMSTGFAKEIKAEYIPAIAAALGVTKSCINHRMRRLIEMGESLS